MAEHLVFYAFNFVAVVADHLRIMPLRSRQGREVRLSSPRRHGLHQLLEILQHFTLNLLIAAALCTTSELQML